MNYRIFPLLLICVFAASGCVHTRTYLAERERVDQSIPGIPVPAKPKTRQVIVLEVVEKGGAALAVAVKPGAKPSEAKTKVIAGDTKTAVEHNPSFALPEQSSIALTPGALAKTPVLAVPSEYKVEKDDTLQKISMKCYGFFSKWTKIYDANKDVIKDPNFVKPGTILKIPALE